MRAAKYTNAGRDVGVPGALREGQVASRDSRASPHNGRPHPLRLFLEY